MPKLPKFSYKFSQFVAHMIISFKPRTKIDNHCGSSRQMTDYLCAHLMIYMHRRFEPVFLRMLRYNLHNVPFMK